MEEAWLDEGDGVGGIATPFVLAAYDKACHLEERNGVGGVGFVDDDDRPEDVFATINVFFVTINTWS